MLNSYDLGPMIKKNRGFIYVYKNIYIINIYIMHTYWDIYKGCLNLQWIQHKYLRGKVFKQVLTFYAGLYYLRKDYCIMKKVKF